MRKKIKHNFVNIIVLACFCLTALFCFAEEQITITTYYPSPVGVYRELRAVYMSVGTNYSNNSQYCWAGGCPNVIDWLNSLVVQGRVGIGTHNASSPLDVVWTPTPWATPPVAYGWAIGMNVSSIGAVPSNFSFYDANADGLTGFTTGDGSDTLGRGWYVVDTHSGVGETEFAVRFDDGIIFLNRARVGGPTADDPTLNVSGDSYFNESVQFNDKVFIGGGAFDPSFASVNSALDVRGYSNTCVVMGYNAADGVDGGITDCPASYYIVQPDTVNPSRTVPKFMCCKVCANEGISASGGCNP